MFFAWPLPLSPHIDSELHSRQRDCFLQLTLKSIKNSNNRTAIKRLVTSTKLYFYYENICFLNDVVVPPPLSSLSYKAVVRGEERHEEQDSHSLVYSENIDHLWEGTNLPGQ